MRRKVRVDARAERPPPNPHGDPIMDIDISVLGEIPDPLGGGTDLARGMREGDTNTEAEAEALKELLKEAGMEPPGKLLNAQISTQATGTNTLVGHSELSSYHIQASYLLEEASNIGEHKLPQEGMPECTLCGDTIVTVHDDYVERKGEKYCSINCLNQEING